MTSQIAERNAAPSRGLLHGLWRDGAAAAVLLLVWTTLWTFFLAGVLAPAAGMGAGEREAEAAAETPAWVVRR